MSGLASSIPSLRGLVGLTGTAVLLLAACGPGTQPSAPTAAPKPTAPPAPTAQPAQPTQAAPVARPAGTTAPGAPAITISGPFEGEAKALNAAGATFPAPLYQKWSDESS